VTLIPTCFEHFDGKSLRSRDERNGSTLVRASSDTSKVTRAVSISADYVKIPVDRRLIYLPHCRSKPQPAVGPFCRGFIPLNKSARISCDCILEKARARFLIYPPRCIARSRLLDSLYRNFYSDFYRSVRSYAKAIEQIGIRSSVDFAGKFRQLMNFLHWIYGSRLFINIRMKREKRHSCVFPRRDSPYDGFYFAA
jgi:hypothetical protein